MDQESLDKRWDEVKTVISEAAEVTIGKKLVPTRASALGLCFLLPHTVPRISNDDLRTHEGALSFCKKPPQDDTRDTR